MASEQAILNIMGRALWDPKPTAGSDLRARQLAAALGFPPTWRVVRTIEDHDHVAPAAVAPVAAPLLKNDDNNGNDKGKAMETVTGSMDAAKKNMNEEEEKAASADTTTTTPTTIDKTVTSMKDAKEDDKVEETDAASKKNDGDAAKDPKITTHEGDSNSKDVAVDGKKEDVVDKMDIDQDEPMAAQTVAEKASVDTNAEKGKSKAAIPESAQEVISSSNALADNGTESNMEINDKEIAATKAMATIITTNQDDKPEPTPEEATKETVDSTVVAGNSVATTSIANDEHKTGNKEAKTDAKAIGDGSNEKNEPAVPSTSCQEPTAATSLETRHHDEKVPATTTSRSSITTAATTTKTTTIAKKRRVIVDRIYAGKPGTECDMWFNHYAAMQAAQQWDEIIHSNTNNEESSTAVVQLPSPFHFQGGHLLPRVAKFEKNDKVEVFFENKWWDAKILRKKEHPVDGFRYQVHYEVDGSKQSGVEESLIRHRRAEKDPHHVATLLGFDAGWQAVSTGHNRWKITSPSGVTYPSKKAALQAAKEEVTKAAEVGDPPWRTTGHEYIGRAVLYSQEHAVSARRKITVEQTGKVVGWISATDVDKAGEPGFVSETTGQPANLFHVEFDDTISPQNHPYPSYLVQSQDLEEFEVEACLIPERTEEEDDGSPSKKKARKR